MFCHDNIFAKVFIKKINNNNNKINKNLHISSMKLEHIYIIFLKYKFLLYNIQCSLNIFLINYLEMKGGRSTWNTLFQLKYALWDLSLSLHKLELFKFSFVIIYLFGIHLFIVIHLSFLRILKSCILMLAIYKSHKNKS